MITDIQKYSIHDGEGIRTTVFFKGCPLSCRWCHNPETQNFGREMFFYEERCTGCGECVKKCMNGALALEKIDTKASNSSITENTPKIIAGKALTDRKKCFGCGICVDECVNNAREICGREVSVEELMEEILKDQAFYETSHGGVTLSGGEVLSQDMNYVVALAKACVKNGISVNIDTSGYAPYENIHKLLPYVKAFLYDIKLMDSREHKLYTGVGNEVILDNLERLNRDGGRIWISIPVIGNVNDTYENMEAVAEFLLNKNIEPEYIHLLPFHATGSSKYERIGRIADDGFVVPSEEKLEYLQNIFISHGFKNVLIRR